jgi:hypothetical protein
MVEEGQWAEEEDRGGNGEESGCHSFPEPLAPVSCFGHLRCSLHFFTKVQKHVTSHMTTTRRVRHVIHVTITHQVTGRVSFLQFTLQYRRISFSASGSPAGSAEQASPEHVCSGYCLTAYCHTHLSHRSDGCSCSRRLLRFPSDIYCSRVIFSYVSFCINTVASSELSPQTQSPRYQSSRLSFTPHHAPHP